MESYNHILKELELKATPKRLAILDSYRAHPPISALKRYGRG